MELLIEEVFGIEITNLVIGFNKLKLYYYY